MTRMPGCGAIRRSCFWTPYAKALDGQVHWRPAVYGYLQGGDDRVRNDADSAPFVPRSVVTNPWFEWGDDHLPRTPWHETVLLPGEKMGQQWLTDLDTTASSTRPETRLAGTTVAVAAYSLQILRRV